MKVWNLLLALALLTVGAVMCWSPAKAEETMASYYWQGHRTATGARFNPNGMTAAHKTWPFGTKVRVTSHATGRSVVVTINDRGPFVRGRAIDLARGAAAQIGMLKAGVTRVTMIRLN